MPNPFQQFQLVFSYWKTSYTSVLDICLLDEAEKISCLDSISGLGHPQWIRRMIHIPNTGNPFKVIFRARNIKTIEDFIGLDDVRLSEQNELPEANIFEHEQQLSPERIDDGNVLLGGDQQNKNFIPFGSQLHEGQPPLRFPEFPSLIEGLSPLRSDARLAPEKSQICEAIKCTFLENDSCLWTLGKNWKLSEGNIAFEGVGESSLQSGYFKAPITSFIELDLWMSDNAQLTISETVDPKREDTILFARKGMLGNGWHRFRIPLKPSPTPVLVKILNSLPMEEGFVTISNIRLVNGNGDDVGCETTGQSPNVPPLLFGSSQLGLLAPIQPRRDTPERLTAFQNFQTLITTTDSTREVPPTNDEAEVLHSSSILKNVKMERTHKMIEPRPTTISEDFTSDGARPSTANPWSSRIFIPQTSKILSEPRQQVEA
uniref:MAM domain-containing protein n=1 Tax=Acrobeloides nanus TaxID=290746 RepID=A0A914CI75_9BILA